MFLTSLFSFETIGFSSNCPDSIFLKKSRCSFRPRRIISSSASFSWKRKTKKFRFFTSSFKQDKKRWIQSYFQSHEFESFSPQFSRTWVALSASLVVPASGTWPLSNISRNFFAFSLRTSTWVETSTKWSFNNKQINKQKTMKKIYR